MKSGPLNQTSVLQPDLSGTDISTLSAEGNPLSIDAEFGIMSYNHEYSGAQSGHEFPRVLVICFHSLNYSSGTGIVFSELFKGWPLDAIAQIYGEGREPDPQICKLHRRMSVENVPLDRALRRMLGHKRVATLGEPSHPSWSETVGRTSAFQVRVRSLIAAWADCVSYHLDTASLNWIRSFAPEVIFTNLGSIRQIRLVEKLTALLKIPIVTYFNDDWPRTHFKGDILKAVPRWWLLHSFDRLMRKGTVGSAASVTMANEFTARYGIPFEPFMYCVETSSSPPLPPGGNETRFCYVGGLHLDRWRSLAEIAVCLDELSRTGLQAKLLVYAPQKDCERYGHLMSAGSSIQLMGSVRADEVPATLLKNHVVVHVESFGKELREYTRLSFSTKIPQYLAAGRPVLAYGPEDQASCQYVAQTGSGLVVGRQSHELLKLALIKLSTQPDVRREMGERAWRVAREKHEPGYMRARFREMLAGAASKEDKTSHEVGR